MMVGAALPPFSVARKAGVLVWGRSCKPHASCSHPAVCRAPSSAVTADCKAAGDTEGGPLGVGCSRAEIWLTTSTNEETLQDAAATTTNQVNLWDGDFLHPNGLPATPGLYATTGSIISFTNSMGEDGRQVCDA
jgi:hypothetical protein